MGTNLCCVCLRRKKHESLTELQAAHDIIVPNFRDVAGKNLAVTIFNDTTYEKHAALALQGLTQELLLKLIAIQSKS